MNVRSMVVLAGAVAVAANVYGGGLNTEGDWQVWYGLGTSTKIGEWKLKLEDEVRSGDDMKDTFYNHVEFGVSRGVKSWLDLGLNYRYIQEKKKGEWETENRPHVNATFKWKLGDWAFSDRNRLEYRDLENSADAWRYRNKLTVYPPFKLFGEKFKPYVADEVYEDLQGNDIERNRVYVGAEYKFADWLKSDLFYIWQSSYKDGEWVDINVVNLKLEVIF